MEKTVGGGSVAGGTAYWGAVEGSVCPIGAMGGTEAKGIGEVYIGAGCVLAARPFIPMPGAAATKVWCSSMPGTSCEATPWAVAAAAASFFFFFFLFFRLRFSCS